MLTPLPSLSNPRSPSCQQSQIDAVRPPCVTGGPTFVAASNTTNWSGRPSSSRRLPAGTSPADAVAQCAAQCNRRPGCVAYSVSVRDPRGRSPAARSCDIWVKQVPARLCAPGEAAFACGLQSNGAFRISWK